MKVLVACEESQTVCKAFREKGHEAYSCDIQDCSGGHPEWHICDDVTKFLNPITTYYGEKGISFYTYDGYHHWINSKWDLIIAHPPCTYLTVAANKYYNVEKYGKKAVERINERKLAADFFMEFINADCERIAVENPIGVMSTLYRKPDCIIQPYQFGHNERKSTCLWLKNLPALKPTNIVEFKPIVFESGKTDSKLHFETWKLPKEERQRLRSKTFEGIAKAMAEQFGGDIRDGEIDGITKWR